MLKTEQILNQKFTPVSKGTYKADEVDAFLKVVAQSYEESLAEKNELIRKMGILADKIESYRNDEEAIKLSLLDAHKMAESINKTSNDKANALVEEAEKKAAQITSDAESKAVKSIEEAREQAKSIVDNAKTAVASLTERAQTETGKAIAAAQKKAEEIVSDADKKSAEIIGNSKKEYEYYVAETAKLKEDADKFKAEIEALCNNQLALLKSVPEISFEAPAEEIIKEAVDEVIEEAPVEEVIEEAVEEAPVEEVIEEAAVTPAEDKKEAAEEVSEADEAQEIELDGSLDDLLEFLNGNSESEPELASDIDDLLPESVDLDIDTVAEEAEDSSEDDGSFKLDLDAIDDIVFDEDEEDKKDDDDDITSLFDTLFDE